MINVSKYAIHGSYVLFFLGGGTSLGQSLLTTNQSSLENVFSPREPQKTIEFRFCKSYIQMYFNDFESFPCNNHFIVDPGHVVLKRFQTG